MSEAERFEWEVGQNWFAKIGIAALAAGVAFLLSLPFAGQPPLLPSLLGYGLVAVLFLVAHLWRESFELVARYLRGAAMLLLYFATLRLFFFGSPPALEVGSPAGGSLLLLATGINAAIALRRRSPALLTLVMVMGGVSALVVDAPWFLLGTGTALLVLATWVRVRYDWAALALGALFLVEVTYVLWAVGNPVLGGPFAIARQPAAAVGFLLTWMVLFAAGTLARPDRPRETPTTQAGALFNCAAGYLVFLLHTLLGFAPLLAPLHLTASLVLLGVAVTFWVRERSEVATFFYAMTGYAALSVAIIRAFPVPDVFVWLSLQSLVVVSTAIWFRSRFIVVANFFIFAAIVIAYVVVPKTETGISIGFGIVALVTARILGWQKQRLVLKTEIMRNAYLAGAFLVFPYAVYHLVPHAWVVPAWVGIAVVYYAFNLVIRNRKYRWMGHGTLLLAAAYVVSVGISRLQGAQRILSFLVLGSILLTVSLVFTRLRSRHPAPRKGGGDS